MVTLSGSVDSYSKKTEAENATKNVLGVKVVVEKIEGTQIILDGGVMA